MKTERLDPWIEGFLDYLRDVCRSGKRSLADRRCTFKRVSLAMEELQPGVPLWKLTLEDYLLWINRERESGSSVRTLSKHISYLRGLLDYAWRSGKADRNCLDGFSLRDSISHQEPVSLSLEEAARLVEACRDLDRRDRVIVLILYGCGLRTKELCDLNITDIDLERQELEVRLGKGSKQRRVPVPDAVWTEILAYLTRQRSKRGPLFRTRAKRKRIASREVSEVVKATARHAKLQTSVTPKVLRHTFGTHLMDRGVDIGVIASLMGHRSPAETGVYLHALPGKRESAIEKLKGFGGKQK
jgi:integrase/recombinase XerD